MYKKSFLAVLVFIGCSFAVDINPGDNWQSKVDANGAGTIFYIKAGTHYGQNIVPKNGDQFIGENGAIMNGNGIKHAFNPIMYGSDKRYHVVIKNLEITNYAPASQYAVIQGNSGWSEYAKSVGWIIENCNIHHNDGAAIMMGDSFVVKNNNIHHQEQIGIVGGGTGSLVYGNEISSCNWNDKYDNEFEAGGTKFAHSVNLSVINNYVHHNHGPGLWTDIDNYGTLYEGNRVEYNYVFGIFHEISYDCIIRCNIARNNGTKPEGWGWGAGIMVTNSENVEIYGNVVEVGATSGDGILLNVQGRRAGGSQTKDYYLKNINVHHNDITFQARNGCSGLNVDPGNLDLVNLSSINFDYNTYHVSDTAVVVDGVWKYLWRWNDRSYGLTEWRFNGRDVHGGWDKDLSVSASFSDCGSSCNLPTISHDPDMQNIIEDSLATFSVSASGSNLQYQWQKSTGTGWNDISGATSSTYSVIGKSGDDGSWFRCRISTSCGAPAYSKLSVLGICSPFTLISTSSNQYVESGNMATLSVNVTGSAINYRWEKENGASWDSVSSLNPYSFIAYQNDDSSRFRCILSSLCSPNDTSDTMLLNVWTPDVCTPVTITTPWTSFTAVAGAVETLTVVATGQTPMNYKWQRRPDPTTNPWQDLENGNNSKYLLLVQDSDEFDDFRCIVSNGCGPPDTSSSFYLSDVCVPVSVTKQPVSQTSVVGDTVHFVISSIGTNRTNLWYADTGNGWYSTGVRDTVFRFEPVMEHHAGRKLRCIVSGDCGVPDTSKAVTLTVTFQPPSIIVGPKSQKVAEDSIVTFRVTSAGDGLSYIWEKDRGLGWELLKGEVSSHYSRTVAERDNNNRFRVIVTSKYGFDSDTSEPAILTVLFNSAPSNLTYSSKTSIYYKNQPIIPNTPSFSGVATSFTVSPNLPKGLVMDSVTGIITGKPEVLLTSTNYKITASNSFGSTTTDINIIILNSSDLTPPDNNSNFTAVAISKSEIDLKWNTPESKSSDADTVYIYYSRIKYPSPESIDKTLIKKVLPTLSTGEETFHLTNLTSKTQYFFGLWISDTLGNYSTVTQATAVTWADEKYFNPIVVHGKKIDSSLVRLTVTGFSSLPDEVSDSKEYVDTIGIWYSSTGIPAYPNTTSSMIFKLDLPSTKSAGDSYTFDAEVPVLTGVDTSYFFVGSLKWNIPNVGDTIPPFILANADTVLMRGIVGDDSNIVSMNLLLSSASYNGKDSTLSIPITNTTYIDSLVDSMLIWYGYSKIPDFNDRSHVFAVKTSSIVSDPYIKEIKDSSFASMEQYVYFAVILKNTKNVISSFILDSVYVAPLIPDNNIVLKASDVGSQSALLSWSCKDSVRIWYGVTRIPLRHDIEESSSFRLINTTTLDSSVIIKVLDPDETYFFGLQRFENGLWSAVTESSSVSITTSSLVSSHIVKNSILIDSLEFIPSTNQIFVSLSVDTSIQPLSDSLQVGIGYSFSDSTLLDKRLQVIELRGTDTSFFMMLNEPMLFDTTYYVGGFIRELGTKWFPPLKSGIDSISTKNYSSQPVVLFTGRDTSISAFNDNVFIRKTHKYDDTKRTVLHIEKIESKLPKGMITAGMVAFSIENIKKVDSIRVGIRSIPKFDNFDSSEVSLYRINTNGDINILRGSYFKDGVVWIKTTDLSGTFAVLADTLWPANNVERITDVSRVVTYNGRDSFFDTIVVNDEVENIRWKFLTALGGAGNAMFAVDSGLLSSENDTIITEVTFRNISTSSGIMSFIVLDDGVHLDTLNTSRQVTRIDSDPHLLPLKSKWYPVYTSTELDSTEPYNVLSYFTKSKKDNWYDKINFKLMRWYNSKWEEYTKADNNKFLFIPGRVIWVCVDGESRFNLGKGKTTNLTIPYSITVPAQDWVDFGVPFGFDVYLKDAIEKSGADANRLEIYEWVENNVYSAKAIHIPGIPEKENLNAILKSGSLNAYTVYNPESKPVTFVIPPIPTALSDTIGMSKKKISLKNSWTISLKPILNNIGSNEVFCSWVAGCKKSYYPIAPSFGNLYAGVLDSNNNLFGGVKTGLRSENGAIFYIAFKNNGTKDKLAEYLITKESLIFKNLYYSFGSNKIFNTDSNVISFNIPAGQTVTKKLVVGTTDYIKNINNLSFTNSNGIMSLVRSFDFSSIIINYTLPFQPIKSFEITLFDISGKNVWQKNYINDRIGGKGKIKINASLGNSVTYPAGIYFVRMSVNFINGKQTTVGEEKIIYVP